MKVLILSASTGGGHNRAAGALKEYILSADRTNTVEIIDTFEEISKLVNLTVTKGYQLLAKKTPSLYGKIYEAADRDTALSELVNTIISQLGRRLIPLIEQLRPDVIVSCHPFATRMIARMKETHGLDIPIVFIITDFMPHMTGVTGNVEAFVTATAATARVLHEKYGVDDRLIFDCGMPVYDRFYTFPEGEREEMLTSLGLDPERRTVLLMAGSFGVADILTIYEKLLSVDAGFQIIVITGHNRRLYNAFEKMLSDEREFETEDAPEFIRTLSEDNPIKLMYNRTESFKESFRETFRRSTDDSKPTRLFYYVDNVEDYMHISDLIITKPGGLTTSESIACSLPMVVFRSFPGQEGQNADFLAESGAAVQLGTLEEVPDLIGELLAQPERLDRMKTACRQLAHPDACRRIYALIRRMAASKE